MTTTVDIVIRIEVVGTPADVENCRRPLECLADVMAVQAEDGLWSLGHESAENDDGPSEPIANITSTTVHAVLIGDASQEALHARYSRLAAIAEELAVVAVRIPGKTVAMFDRITALVRELDSATKETSWTT